MKERFKKIYEILKELPDIGVYILLFFRIPFLKSDVQYSKQTMIQKIHILGNGPSSLKTFKSSMSENDEVMCVNYFGLTKNFLLIQPKYYVLIDAVYFIDLNDKNLNLINILNKVTWGLTLFIPSKYIKKYSNLLNNDYITLQSIRMDYLPGNNIFVYNLYKYNLATPKFQNVIIGCIYISVNKSFENILLHGVEASEFKNFTVNENNEILLNTEHFYGQNSINMTREGRIAKGEFWKQLSYYVIMLKEFNHVSKYVKHMDCKVYNCTANSYIDAFEKK